MKKPHRPKIFSKHTEIFLPELQCEYAEGRGKRLVYPDYRFKRIYDIPVEFLQSRGLRFLVLDVDNTLTTNEHPVPSDGVCAWLNQLEAASIRAMILSNNHAARVKPFASLLHLPFVAAGKKPLCGGYERCRTRFACEKSEMAVIGDQLLTDVWGGARYGIATILVEPIELEDIWFFKCKRLIERGVLRYHEKRTGGRPTGGV